VALPHTTRNGRCARLPLGPSGRQREAYQGVSWARTCNRCVNFLLTAPLLVARESIVEEACFLSLSFACADRRIVRCAVEVLLSFASYLPRFLQFRLRSFSMRKDTARVCFVVESSHPLFRRTLLKWYSRVIGAIRIVCFSRSCRTRQVR